MTVSPQNLQKYQMNHLYELRMSCGFRTCDSLLHVCPIQHTCFILSKKGENLTEST